MNRENDLGTLIKAVENRKEMLEDRALKPYGLSASQAHILLRLYDADGHMLRLKQLEKQMQLGQSTIVKLIHKMLDKPALVEILDDAHDQRVRLVRLTKQGAETAQAISSVPQQMEQLLRKDMDDESYAAFQSALMQMKNRLEEADEKNIYRK